MLISINLNLTYIDYDILQDILLQDKINMEADLNYTYFSTDSSMAEGGGREFDLRKEAMSYLMYKIGQYCRIFVILHIFF